jgi:hypothetical protein
VAGAFALGYAIRKSQEDATLARKDKELFETNRQLEDSRRVVSQLSAAAATARKPTRAYPTKPLVHDKNILVQPLDGYTDPSGPRTFNLSDYSARCELVPSKAGKSIIVDRLVVRLQALGQGTPHISGAKFRLLEMGKDHLGQIGPDLIPDETARLQFEDILPIQTEPGRSLHLQTTGMTLHIVWVQVDFHYE